MQLKHIFLSLGLLSLAGLKGAAQSSATNPFTTTAVPFLRISPDARAGGMGDAGLATTPDANSGFWNLAKTPFAKSKSAVSATYSPWLKEINGEMHMASLTGYYQLENEQALSASVRYFNMGSIEQTDYNGTLQQTNQPREFAIDLGYSRALSQKAGVGVALRYIHSKLTEGNLNGTDYKAGSAVAADLSFFYNGLNEKGQGWSWGAALSNLGSKINYSNNATGKDFIPAKLGIGGAYTTVFDEDNKLTFAADFNKLLVPSVANDPESETDYHNKGVVESWAQSFSDYNRFQFAAGAEYLFKGQFALRAGYNAETKQEGGRHYFTAGAGINYQSFGFNFSYLAPFNDDNVRSPLSNTMRFGLIYHLEQ